MNNPNSVPSLLSEVAAKMLADFRASSLIGHRGGKGDVREEDLRSNFLNAYLPGTVVAVGQGEALAVDGQLSGECDVMILDPATPPLWNREAHRIVPIECLHGVIEVKSKLTANELKKSWALIRRVKSLPKSAYRSSPDLGRSRRVYGREWTHMPVSGFIFAYEGATLATLGKKLAELAASEPEAPLRIDGIFVLNRGYIVWVDPVTDQINPAPDPEDSFGSVEADPGQVLMAFIGMLYAHFAEAWMPGSLDIGKYMQGSWGVPHKLWRHEPDDSVTLDGGSP